MDYKAISGSTPDELQARVLDIASRASAAIIEIYQTDFDIEHKEDSSPLTLADMASHRIISEGLKALTPDIPVLSEESAGIPYELRRTWETYWLVDPLDGTREFIKRNGEFTVNIALIHQHEPVLGVVHIPVSNIGYFACKGHGAFRVTPGTAATPIRTRRTRAGAITVAGSRSHGNEQQARFFASLGPDAETINRGSSLKFCLIAEGMVDIYPRFGPTSEWDTAAAHCLVREAGGEVTDMTFRPLRYNTKDSLLNPHFLVLGDTEFDWRPYLAGSSE